MAIKRTVSYPSQVRLDIPDMKSIESAVRNDFDEMVQSIFTGEAQSLIVRGFEINMVGAVGNTASGLSVIVSDSAVLHTTSTTSGTLYRVASGTPLEVLNSTTNTKVSGSFTPNSVNYVALDFSRAPDPTTAAPRALWDPTNKIETSKVLPLAETMAYKFIINTTGFLSTSVPMAKIYTDSANSVTKIEDYRALLGRLGSAGFSTPDPSHTYPWNNHTEGRTENFYSSTSSSLNPFRGGDKQFKSLKEWMDAIMSIIKELSGGVFWYSLNSGGSVTLLRQDLGNTITTSRAIITHSAITAGKLNWDQDLKNKVLGSRLGYTISAYSSGNNLILADSEVAYLELGRDLSIVPNLVLTNGSAIVASVGSVAWTSDLVSGDYLKLASGDITTYYEVSSVDSLFQVTLTTVYSGASTGATGAPCVYTYGVYEVVATPSTDRHIKKALRQNVPIQADMYWLFFRDDNGGSTPKIYTRFKAGEIELGESQQIGDNTSVQLLQFVGSTGEADGSPNYSNLPNSLSAYTHANGENLKNAISNNTGNINTVLNILDKPSYDEVVTVGSFIASGTTITIPVNTRLSGSPQQFYTVGKGALEIYLNGQYLFKDTSNGWSEVGASLTSSSQIIINQDLVVGDEVTYRLDATGGPGSGGSASPDDDFFTLTAEPTADSADYVLIYDVSTNSYKKQTRGNFLTGISNNINVATKTSNYTVLVSDNCILGDATGGIITLTLPTPAAAAGLVFNFKKIDVSANTVIINAGSYTIDGANTFNLSSQYDAITLVSNGIEYFLL
jgi:hypothetical protein